ncbi:hypothetical protein CRE_01258 [Caenorhabditis remanei]|uniref:Uncharacterized protein n=1 Tax=Caenorhabditis remanei TaxID=31234 RepID=E3N9M1_CAERE|nr:hypothetical protein CRE_01258 [Caenorhabditis remanei]
MNIAMQELTAERDTYKRRIEANKENAEEIREQYLKELNDRDQIIQTLINQLTDSQKNSARKKAELQEYHAQESSDKSQLIYNLNMRLCLEEQQYTEKLMVLRKEHAKQVEGMNLELQLLKTQQEQHVKELNDKDLVIQDLAIRLSASEQQTIDKMMELTNEKDRHSQVIHKFREESLLAERRLESVRMMLKGNLRQKMKEVDLELTQLHTELGKLYIELQEAKKSQEALMARLAAKNKGIEYLTRQHEAKLAAKDSEIQRLTKMV